MPAVKYRPSAAITSTRRASRSTGSSTAARSASIMAGETALSLASRVKVTVSTPSSSDRQDDDCGLAMAGAGEQGDDGLGLQVVLEQVLRGALHVRAPVPLRPGRVARPDQADQLRVGPDDPLEALVRVVVVAAGYLGAQVGGDNVLQHGALDGHGLVAA